MLASYWLLGGKISTCSVYAVLSVSQQSVRNEWWEGANVGYHFVFGILSVNQLRN